VKLTLSQARRLAIRAQALDGSARDVLDVVRRIGFLQLDPTSRVAPSHVLVLWSRLGAYDLSELDRLLWEERALFEDRAAIRPTEDFPTVRTRFLRPQDSEWLEANAAFRRYILRELRRRGPLRSDEFEDRAAVPWVSTGWTHDRNVTQMLEFLSAHAKVMVAGRAARTRVWDLPERVLPKEVVQARPPSRRRLARRRLEALGIARLAYLEAEPTGGRRVEVEGVRGEWRVLPEHLERADEPVPVHTTLLSPFDRLIHDRQRAVDLFGFRYRLQIYAPKTEREYGFYVLPVLHGERLVGRVDPELDRRAGVLRVNAVYPEPGVRWPGKKVERALTDLARFLGANRVALP
jgi:hypothetical protein